MERYHEKHRDKNILKHKLMKNLMGNDNNSTENSETNMTINPDFQNPPQINQDLPENYSLFDDVLTKFSSIF